MNRDIKGLAVLILAIIVIIFIVRACQDTKTIKIKQKSNDDKASLSIEVKKEQ